MAKLTAREQYNLGGYVHRDDFPVDISQEEYADFIERHRKTAYISDAKYDDNGNIINELALTKEGSAIFIGFVFE